MNAAVYGLDLEPNPTYEDDPQDIFVHGFKYSPDQPRDELGRFAGDAVVASIKADTWYHGSTATGLTAFDNAKIRGVDADAPYTGIWLTANDKMTSPSFVNPRAVYEVAPDISRVISREDATKFARDIQREPDYAAKAEASGAKGSGDYVRMRLLEAGYDAVLHSEKPTINTQELERTGRTEFSVGGTRYQFVKENLTINGERVPSYELYHNGEAITGYGSPQEFIDQTPRELVVLDARRAIIRSEEPSPWLHGQKYSPDQLRDELGRFADEGRSGGGSQIPTQAVPITDAQMARDEKWFARTYPDATPEEMAARVSAAIEDATPEQRAAGMRWYQEAHDTAARLAAEHGLTIEQAAGMLAATSPQSRWSSPSGNDDPEGRGLDRISNVAIAERAMMMANGEWKGDKLVVTKESIDEWRDKALKETLSSKYKGTDEARAARTAKVEEKYQYHLKNSVGEYTVSTMPSDKLAELHPDTGYLHDNFAKAIDIARGANPANVLGGTKVRSFFNNIKEPTTSRSVTIDSHQGNLMVGAGKGSSLSKGFSNHQGAYRIISESVRTAAVEKGILPNQAQAISWIVQQSRDYRPAKKETDDDSDA